MNRVTSTFANLTFGSIMRLPLVLCGVAGVWLAPALKAETSAAVKLPEAHAADTPAASPGAATVTAGDDTYHVIRKAPLSVPANAGVLANDAHEHHLALRAELVEEPGCGSVILNEDGSFVYTPGETYKRRDSFVYRVRAGELVSANARVRLAAATPAKKMLRYGFGPNAITDMEGTDITATVPFGTDLTRLVAVFEAEGKAVTVGGVAQESGRTANDFTDPVVYRVTATDTSTRDYTVAIRTLAKNTYMERLVLQAGTGGYEEGWDSNGRDDKMKLTSDQKQELTPYHERMIREGKTTLAKLHADWANYRHLIGWKDLDKWVKGANIQVRSVRVGLYYCDEFWSYYHYHLALHRSLDGTKDSIEPEPAATAVIVGSRNTGGTPIKSWVEFELRPEVVADWLANPAGNHGLVLRQASREQPPGKKSGGAFVVFRPNGYGVPALRPKLTITYTFTGNAPPYRPSLSTAYAGARVGSALPVRWTEATPRRDPNGDPVHYEVRVGRDVAAIDAWPAVAAQIAAPAQSCLADLSRLAKGAGYRLAVRAVDNRGSAGDWTVGEGAFELAGGDIPFNIGIGSPVERFRRLVAPDLAPTNETAVALARGEREGVQLVISHVMRDLAGVTLEITDLKGPAGATLAADAIRWNPVGYVQTKAPKYAVPRTGWWADPLLPPAPFDLAVGKTQPVWITVHCPPTAKPGLYAGTIRVKAGLAAQTVKLSVRVYDFTLPVRGALKTMVVGDCVEGVLKFFGVPKNSAEGRVIKEAVWSDLCAHRLGPGGSAFNGFRWNRACYPVKAENGAYDFSEVDRLAEFLIPRGMNAFVIASCPKLGKWGFPKTYSAQWRKDWSDCVQAYAAHLRQKGWLDMAYAYNIDEAPPKMWEACKENYRMAKTAAPDLRVMQCLNNPKGVMALAGFADTWDVNIAQYEKSRVAERQKAGDEVWWCVCCWPWSHPNLFVDYPAIDARIIGWLSWKLNVSGFEYWSVTSWKGNDRPLTEIENAHWKANVFGEYNGDGYLYYPGPNNTLLSSIRLEALRDGFEDYEYLALLRARLKGQAGEAAERARRLLEIDDRICSRDLRYTRDPQDLLAARARIAEAIEQLGVRR
ncbi:MAG: DUF4091 domain-containing protein [Kiritimatiellae bacterium]|nr:DUF4091 domain-containing protein [Kiritimatiellia bacterium]